MVRTARDGCRAGLAYEPVRIEVYDSRIGERSKIEESSAVRNGIRPCRDLVRTGIPDTAVAVIFRIEAVFRITGELYPIGIPDVFYRLYAIAGNIDGLYPILSSSRERVSTGKDLVSSRKSNGQYYQNDNHLDD